MNRPVRDPYAGWCERFSDRLPAYRLPTRLAIVNPYAIYYLDSFFDFNIVGSPDAFSLAP
jgi:hypothetical protein